MSIRKDLNTRTREFLVGKTIKTARYLNKEELIGCFGDDTYKAPLVIEFTDGSWIFPMSDDEGNNGGALTGGKGEEEYTFPVLWPGL